MIRFAECAKAVGYDMNRVPPEKKYVWHAYKAGKVFTFDNEKEARQVSKNIERQYTNDDEYKNFWIEQRKKEAEAVAYWYQQLSEYYGGLTTKIFSLCYTMAYEKSHAFGYDEVADSMFDFVLFAKRIIECYDDDNVSRFTIASSFYKKCDV